MCITICTDLSIGRTKLSFLKKGSLFKGNWLRLRFVPMHFVVNVVFCNNCRIL